MQEINIIEVSKDMVDGLMQVCFRLRDEKYYIAYETDVHIPISVLFKDLTWIRKNRGVERNESSPITKESLNAGRKNEIANHEKALKYNVPMWELEKFDENGDVLINPETNEPYKPMKLTKSGRKYFQNDIDLGLCVLCKIL